VQIAVRNEFDPLVYTNQEFQAIRRARLNNQLLPSFYPEKSATLMLTSVTLQNWQFSNGQFHARSQHGGRWRNLGVRSVANDYDEHSGTEQSGNADDVTAEPDMEGFAFEARVVACHVAASLDYSLGSMAAARFRLSTKGESKLQQRQFCAVWG